MQNEVSLQVVGYRYDGTSVVPMMPRDGLKDYTSKVNEPLNLLNQDRHLGTQSETSNYLLQVGDVPSPQLTVGGSRDESLFFRHQNQPPHLQSMNRFK